ncbi:hypothetical protein [Streptomyces lavendulae]|uniref:hypothetical protein n=1 Tax=Streptomyces lavendulae TaxID=1914 RepID=UPI0031E5ED71
MRLFRTLNAPSDVDAGGLGFGSTDPIPAKGLSGVCLSFGLGGHNAALLFREPGMNADMEGAKDEK